MGPPPESGRARRGLRPRPGLAGRAYRSGLGVARLQGIPRVPLLFGMPRFVFREIPSHGIDWVAGWLTGDGHRRLDGKLRFYHWRGKLREYWRLRGARGDEQSR